MNALQILFTAIANAIRAKKSTQETIKAEDFPTEISNITTGKLTNEEYAEANDDVDDILEGTIPPSGTINITENGIYDVTNYVSADVNVSGSSVLIVPNGVKLAYSLQLPTTMDTSDVLDMSYMFFNCTTLTTIPNLDTSNVTNMRNMFSQCSNLVTIPNLDTSNVTDMSYMFQQCSNLTTVPLLDTGNVTNMSEMFRACAKLTAIPNLNISKVYTMTNTFNGCSQLTTIPSLDTSNVENIDSAFRNCTSLTNLPIFNFSKITSASYTFTGSTALTNESLNNILASIANGTQISSRYKTLSRLGLTAQQATTCIGLSNWSAAESVGWTTGY